MPSRVAELEAEVQQLREQLGKAKGVNDAMWETVVQRVLKQGKVKERKDELGSLGMATTDVEEESGRNRKRGKK